MKIGQPADKPAIAPHGASSATTTTASTSSTASTAAPAAPTTARAIPEHADPSAKIRLSNTASSLLEGGASNAEFDADKVARISKSIDDGSFKIDPGAIADKLIANARELMSRGQN